MKTKKPTKSVISLPDFTSEAALGFFASKVIIGVDEVGRGCLAGPVVAAAAVIDLDHVLSLGFKEDGRRPRKNGDSALFQVRDSKLIPEPAREPLSKLVAECVRFYSVQEASVEEIEELNILYAAHLAMERAVFDIEKQLGREADAVLIDGNLIPKNLKSRGHALVKGDLKSITIGCASILAKVYRDKLMQKFESIYPGYGMAKHKGYGTPFHLSQLIARGVTPIHRKSFKGVGELLHSEIEDALVE